MNAANLIGMCVNEMIFAMTAREKWSSASSGISSTGSAIPTWLIISVSIILVASVVISVIVSNKRKAQKA